MSSRLGTPPFRILTMYVDLYKGFDSYKSNRNFIFWFYSDLHSILLITSRIYF